MLCENDSCNPKSGMVCLTKQKLSKESVCLQALSIAFHANVPLFLIIAVGYTGKRLGRIGPEEVRWFNRVTFYTFKHLACSETI